jgi:hypothetical protein
MTPIATSEREPALLVLAENDHCASGGDRVKRNQVVPAPISLGKNSLVDTGLALAQRKGWACC